LVMTPPNSQPSVERPLSGTSKLALAGAAGGMILLFYLFVVASLVLLLILLAIELVLVIALARIGLAGYMAKLMGEHLAPLPA
jgi:hypothetical protein